MKEPLSQKEKESWDHLDNARKRFIHSIASSIDLYGVPPSIGRLYGTMYFHNKPMTLDEMADALGMSKMSMSTGIRSLLDIKMVHKTFQKGVRKDLYMVEEDWYNTFFYLFSFKWRRRVENVEIDIEKTKLDLERLRIETTDEELKETIERDLAKLEHAAEYYIWLRKLFKSFETGEIFKLIPKPGSE